MSILLVKNAAIVDGSQDRPTDPVDFIIEDGTFVEVGAGLTAPATAEVLDLEGAIVLPGLIDCHVHVIATTADLGRNAALPDSLVTIGAQKLMKAMLMRGFTTVRDLGGCDIGLKQASEQGLIEAPRLVICGKALSQTGGHTDYRGPYSRRDVSWYADKLGALGRICDGVAEVQRAAREEIKAGAEFVKIMADGGVSSPSDPIGYMVFSEAEIRAAVEIAKNFGTYVSAHLYDDRAIVRALDCGVECIEHGNLISDATIARIAREGQMIVPTNVTYDYLATEGAKFGLPPESVAKVEDVRAAGIEALPKLHAAGVTMGYGSDLLGGMQVHQSGEFALRARCMPTHDVIRSATLDAAKVLRMEGKVGAIAPGAFGDFVVARRDPLKDISVLSGQGEGLSMIVQGGRVVKAA